MQLNSYRYTNNGKGFSINIHMHVYSAHIDAVLINLIVSLFAEKLVV